MFKKMSFLSVAVSILLVSPLFAEQINSTWVGGAWGYWNTASNWNPAIVPNNGGGNTFRVTIDAGTNDFEVIMQGNNYIIESLDCYGAIYLDQWYVGTTLFTLQDPNGITNYGNLELGEDLEIAGNIINYGSLEADELVLIDEAVGEGDITNYGSVEIPDGADISGDVINSNGATVLFEDMEDAVAIEGNLINATGGLVTINCSIRIEGDVNNAGQINFSSLECEIDGQLINTGTLYNKVMVPLRIEKETDANNSGTIEVNAGGGVAFDSNLLNEPNGTIKLLGGTLGAGKIIQKPDANFMGFGGITGNVQIDPDAIIKLTGPTNIVGDVNIPAGATLEISDGQTLITGQTTCKGTIHLKGGTVIFQGGCDCSDCIIVNEAGLDRNHFDLNADGKVDLEDFDYFAESWLWEASWY